MQLRYDIPKYIAKIKMSSFKRILVEGKDDRNHIKNLLDFLKSDHRVKIDTAEEIEGVDAATAKNNREKINYIHQYCIENSPLNNLYLFCDREFYKFEITDKIYDLMSEHEFQGNLSFTLGHSIENYFFNELLLADAYRYLCGSSYKSEALKVFKSILPSALKFISATTFASREINKASYPVGCITWKDFEISGADIKLKIEQWKERNCNATGNSFISYYESFLNISSITDPLCCSRFSRGHTAMILLQRMFSACIYEAIKYIDITIAEKDANTFSNISESNISTALSESWIRQSQIGSVKYPRELIESVTT